MLCPQLLHRHETGVPPCPGQPTLLPCLCAWLQTLHLILWQIQSPQPLRRHRPHLTSAAHLQACRPQPPQPPMRPCPPHGSAALLPPCELHSAPVPAHGGVCCPSCFGRPTSTGRCLFHQHLTAVDSSGRGSISVTALPLKIVCDCDCLGLLLGCLTVAATCASAGFGPCVRQNCPGTAAQGRSR